MDNVQPHGVTSIQHNFLTQSNIKQFHIHVSDILCNYMVPRGFAINK